MDTKSVNNSYDNIPLLKSKDDTSTPTFIPFQCPICYIWVWELKDTIKCNLCNEEFCLSCCETMKKTKSLIKKTKNHRRYILCPVCNEYKLLRIENTHDIENQNDTSYITNLIVERNRTARINNRNSNRKGVKLLILYTCIFIVFFVLGTWIYKNS